MNESRNSSLASKAAPWFSGSVLVVAAIIVLYFFTGATASGPSRTAAPVASDITHGPADAAFSVVEYSDFQCPFCAEYALWLTQLRAKYGHRVQFVFRNYPLAKHEWAQFAAQVAYAASLQGKFWEMHDLLFAGQEEWASSDAPWPYFDAYAEGLGLDLERLHADADAQSTADFIKRQAAEGKRAGVKHTPWLIVGDEVVLPRSFEEFDQLIQEKL